MIHDSFNLNKDKKNIMKKNVVLFILFKRKF